MKKSILNLGKVLNQMEQKSINGGYSSPKECAQYCNSCTAVFTGGGIEFVCA